MKDNLPTNQEKEGGCMMNGWRQSTWGDEVSLEYGKSLRDYTNSLGQVRVYGSNGAIGYTDKELAKGPGVILGRKGAYRGVEYSKSSFFVIDTAYYVVPKKELDMRWIYYAIKHHKLGEIDDGSPIPSTTRAAVYVRDLDIPPPAEQRAIAVVLGTLDDKIELNRRMNKTLEEVAQTLFKSWFVDFDPVKAKAEGRKPEGMDEATASLFPSSFTESPLGAIPEGWQASSVGECFKLVMGQSPPGETYNEVGEGIAFYQGRTDFGFRFPTERVYCNAPARFAERNDTLVSVRAPVGDVNMVLDRCCIGRGVAALRHNSGASSFTYYAAQQLQAHFKNFEGEGTVFGSINKTNFAELPHIEPKDKIIVLYEAIAGSLDKKIKTNEDQIRTLTEVRDNLLPRLISGKLRVGEISETVEALAS